MTIRRLTSLLFVLAGIVNFLPVVGVLGAAQLESLYGQAFAGSDLLLLLRHRAVLFGLLGAFLIVAAFRAQWRVPAAIAGLVSMVAYLLLALPLSAHGPALQKVFWIDVVACVLLLVGFMLSRRLNGVAR